ncbi:DUF4136 domain-containing protein [Mangrovitalea sediminis]|uniref:DUF4136 domain-containing protein n=1 Tax=Mangrovitalea sediminis TaxID=1982043 RepID=UPI000BE5ED54|nr:DUF4136 domain-containing protein [Mangrovitalea sediminis]
MRVILLLALLLAGCASPVTIDYDNAVSFAGYRTYAFAAPDKASQYQTLDGRRIEAAINRALQLKGLKPVAVADASLIVHYRIEEEKSLDTTGWGFGFGTFHDPLGFGMATTPPIQERKEGKLVVEMVDGKSHQSVWKAAGRRYLNENMSPKERTDRINEIVHDMFQRFPP